MKKFILLILVVISFSCKKEYNSQLELEIAKNVIKSTNTSNYGEYTRKVDFYNDLGNPDNDPRVMEAGIKINVNQLHSIKKISEIISKSDDPNVLNEANRLLDSLSNARKEFLNKRYIDYTKYSK